MPPIGDSLVYVLSTHIIQVEPGMLSSLNVP